MTRRGNPAWVKGKSANPKGRPVGRTDRLNVRRHRFAAILYSWETRGNRAEAARRAGYAPRSARSTACRLMKTAEVRATLREMGELLEELEWVQTHRPWLTMADSMWRSSFLAPPRERIEGEGVSGLKAQVRNCQRKPR